MFLKLRASIQLFLLLQSLGMLIGSLTHLDWIINNGFLSKHYHTTVYTSVFWDSLLFIDPIAAFLLIVKPNIGVQMTALIMVIDVLYNGYLCLRVFPNNPALAVTWLIGNWMFLCQLAFGIFVLITYKSIRKEIKLKSTSLRHF